MSVPPRFGDPLPGIRYCSCALVVAAVAAPAGAAFVALVAGALVAAAAGAAFVALVAGTAVAAAGGVVGAATGAAVGPVGAAGEHAANNVMAPKLMALLNNARRVYPVNWDAMLQAARPVVNVATTIEQSFSERAFRVGVTLGCG